MINQSKLANRVLSSFLYNFNHKNMLFKGTQLIIQVLCLIAIVEASTLSRGHHNSHERKHHSKRHARKYQDDSAQAYDQVYSPDFDAKREV